MFAKLYRELDAALAPLTAARNATPQTVGAALRRVRALLLEAEMSTGEVDAFAEDALNRMARAQGRAKSLEGAIAAEALRAAALALPPVAAGARRWELCDLPRRVGGSGLPPAMRFSEPVLEQRAGAMRGLRFRGIRPYADRDAHAAGLSHESVHKLLRSLGRGLDDFGPEPPRGGQPALIA